MNHTQGNLPSNNNFDKSLFGFELWNVTDLVRVWISVWKNPIQSNPSKKMDWYKHTFQTEIQKHTINNMCCYKTISMHTILKIKNDMNTIPENNLFHYVFFYNPIPNYKLNNSYPSHFHDGEKKYCFFLSSRWKMKNLDVKEVL